MPCVLFGRDEFNVGLPWSELAPLLPGWDIRACPPDELGDHLTVWTWCAARR